MNGNKNYLKNELTSILTEVSVFLKERFETVHADQMQRNDRLGVKSKADGSFVTEVDLHSEQILLERLSKVEPRAAFLTEESGNIGNSDLVWIVDPLDGTSSFISGHDDYSVQVALIDRGNFVVSGMVFPSKNLSLICTTEELILTDAQNRVLPALSYEKELISGHVYFRRCRHPKFISPTFDSGYALMQFILGELSGVVIYLSHHRAWDLAPAAMMIQQLGGVVTNENGEKLMFSSAKLNGDFFIAGNRDTHPILLKLIDELIL